MQTYDSIHTDAYVRQWRYNAAAYVRDLNIFNYWTQSIYANICMCNHQCGYTNRFAHWFKSEGVNTRVFRIHSRIQRLRICSCILKLEGLSGHSVWLFTYIQSWTRTSCRGQGSNMKMIPIPKTILSSGLANLFIVKIKICHDRRYVLKRGFCATILIDGDFKRRWRGRHPNQLKINN